MLKSGIPLLLELMSLRVWTDVLPNDDREIPMRDTIYHQKVEELKHIFESELDSLIKIFITVNSEKTCRIQKKSESYRDPVTDYLYVFQYEWVYESRIN